MYDRISSFFFENIFKYQTDLRKGFNPQSCLVALINNFKNHNTKEVYMLHYLRMSKAFDYLPHDLIIAKLHAYRFDKAPLRLMQCYLIDRYQSVKINNSYSLWSLIKYGVPQGSILCPILFKILLYVLYDI